MEILSTGGTARLLTDNGIPVIEVSDYTGFPEMMDGRVKTLHPKIHGGILGRRGTDDAVMQQNGIHPIDLMVVNLYPFEQTVADPDCPTLSTAIENIDIGGPTMLRAAAKNHRDVTVVVDSADYARVLAEMAANGGDGQRRHPLSTWRSRPSNTPPATTAPSPTTWAPRRGRRPAAEFPRTLNLQFLQKCQTMRYGENPHQNAAFFVEQDIREASVATARQLQGKELSYNNVADTDAALECVKQFEDGPACVIVKHANPCGVAFGATLRRPTTAPTRPTRNPPSAALSPSTASWTPPRPGPSSSASSSR